jgi:hypothetical protein
MYRRVPRRNSTVPKHPLFIALFLLSGCAAYQPRPLAPAQMAEAYEARTLDSRDLRDFVARGLRREITQWPLKSWDFSTLTLAAFYFSPDLDVARAKWAASKAAIKTAGAIPNPVLQIPFEYATNAPRGESPYTLGLGLDIPIETAGKRGYRLTQADQLSDAARFNVGNVAWQYEAGCAVSCSASIRRGAKRHCGSSNSPRSRRSWICWRSDFRSVQHRPPKRTRRRSSSPGTR